MELGGWGEGGEAEAGFGGVLEVGAGVGEEDEGHLFFSFFLLFLGFVCFWLLGWVGLGWKGGGSGSSNCTLCFLLREGWHGLKGLREGGRIAGWIVRFVVDEGILPRKDVALGALEDEVEG